MDIARFPRRRYTPHPTPLERLPRLGAVLGVDLWIKRDDLLGLAGGGNKTRKLEFLVAEAIAEGCDTLVTVGAPQSNHCRLTLAAAAREGLKCRLVLEERVPGTYDPNAVGNTLLFELLGAASIRMVPGGSDLAAVLQEEADAATALGGRARVIVGGGSSPLGALGYAACALELAAQAHEAGLSFKHVVVASGSAGTHAGLAVGMHALGVDACLHGVSVRRPAAEQIALVHGLAVQAAALARAQPTPEKFIAVDDRFIGPGYSLPTPAMVEAVRLTAALEGVLLDPVYTGKAMAGLIGLAREGAFARNEPVVFVHTGGAPSLHAFAKAFRDPSLASP
jgi:D-cysteine desulfhydrase